MPRWIGCVLGVLTACAAPNSGPAPTAPIAAAPTTIDATAAPSPAAPTPRPPDPDDVLPPDHTIAPPAAQLAVEIPAGVTVAPPADGWWKRRGACPKATRLTSHTFTFRPGSRWRAHRCVGTTAAARPETSIRLDVAGDREDAWACGCTAWSTAATPTPRSRRRASA